MVGKRWVFDPDPVRLPDGFEGQIFRIDQAVSKAAASRSGSQDAPRGGDVVISVVDLERSWRDEQFTEGQSVTVRLPEAAELKKATWLGVENSHEPAKACEIERLGDRLLVRLPPLGAAGILRLSR